MGAFVASVRPDLFSLVVSEVGCDPFARVEESTRFAQPAIFCASLASLGSGVTFDFAAGHSLGEFAALVAAGALAGGGALRLVGVRGGVVGEGGGGLGAGRAVGGGSSWGGAAEIAFEGGG